MAAGVPESPDGPVHHEVHRGAARELPDGALLHGRVDLDLSHVGVAAVLVVGQHGHLDHEGPDGTVGLGSHRDTVSEWGTRVQLNLYL